MERLGTLCATALVVAVCSFALAGCSNIDGNTGPCEPDLGSTKAIEKTTPSERFDKIDEDIVDPQGLGPDPQEQFPIDLEADENVTSPALVRTPTATATPRSSLRCPTTPVST